MKRTVLILTLSLLLFAPFTASAFSLVQCGTQTDPTTGAITNPCQLKDLVLLIIRLINYLITAAAVVAIHRIVSVGWEFVGATGNPEKIKKQHEGLQQAFVGFAIIVLSFAFINLLVNGLFGKPGATREWWNPKCIYLDSTNCPQGIFKEEVKSK